MSAYDVAAWQNFYVMVGGAAAVLTDLLFVAMSLHSNAIIAHALHGTRAVGTLLSLMTQLFVAGTVLIPQSTMALGTLPPSQAAACSTHSSSGFSSTSNGG
jgi:hypothetical protein